MVTRRGWLDRLAGLLTIDQRRATILAGNTLSSRNLDTRSGVPRKRCCPDHQPVIYFGFLPTSTGLLVGHSRRWLGMRESSACVDADRKRWRAIG